MEGKCMRCGKPDHQLGQKYAAKNAKYKDSQNRTLPRGMPVQEKDQTESQSCPDTTPDDDDTHIDENGVRQPNPSRVNMLKIVNHIGTTKGPQGKHLKFPITKHPKGPYKHHIVVRVDTGADANCMNEKTFNELFS